MTSNWKLPAEVQVELLQIGSNVVTVPTATLDSFASLALRDSVMNLPMVGHSPAAFLATVTDTLTFARLKADGVSVNTIRPVTIVNDALVATMATPLKEPTAIAILALAPMAALALSWPMKRSYVSNVPSAMLDLAANFAVMATTATQKAVSAHDVPASLAIATVTSILMPSVTATARPVNALSVFTTQLDTDVIPVRPVSLVTLSLFRKATARLANVFAEELCSCLQVRCNATK